jgi:hypothetical protein
MADIKITGYDKNKTTHTEQRWNLYFQLSENPDSTWVQSFNDLINPNEVKPYDTAKIIPTQKLLLVQAHGERTAEELKQAMDHLVSEVNKSQDDATAQLEKLKFD